MKNKIYSFLIASCVVGLSSCESDIDNYMVDDTVGLLNSGYVEAEVLSGLSDPYMLYSLKSGKGFQSANISLIVDEQVLTDYNTENGTTYTALPADCYTISVSNLQFAVDDYRKAFEITWNQDRLAEALESDPSAVIPLRLNVAETGVQVAQDRTTTLLHPKMVVPYVSLSKFGFYTGITPLTSDNAQTDIYLSVDANYIARNDVQYTLAVDEQALADYNEANKTSYQILPAAAYSLPLDGWMIKKSANSGRFKFTFNLDALMPEGEAVKFGEYVLPIRLQSVSSSSVNPDADVILYYIKFQPALIDKTGWSVLDYNSSCKDDPNQTFSKLDGGPENLIDGTVAKFWHSLWSTPASLPYYFVIKMDKYYTLFTIGVDNPVGGDAWRGNAKAGYVEVASSDEDDVNKIEWVKIGDWEAPDRYNRSFQFSVTPTRCNYVRFVITEAFDYHRDNPNGAQMNIAELNFWGD